MKFSAIPFVGYPVSDVERARQFYEGVLGLVPSMDEMTGDGKHWIEYEIGKETLAISNAWPPSGQSGPSVALEVDDLDAALNELKDKGVPISYEPMESPVCRFFGIADPDGNEITIHKGNPA